MGLFDRDSTKKKLKDVAKALLTQYQNELKTRQKFVDAKKKAEERVKKLQMDISKFVDSKYPGGHEQYEDDYGEPEEVIKTWDPRKTKLFDLVHEMGMKVSEANSDALKLSTAVNQQQRKTAAAKLKMQNSANALDEYVERKAKMEKALSSADYKEWVKMYDNIAAELKK